MTPMLVMSVEMTDGLFSYNRNSHDITDILEVGPRNTPHGLLRTIVEASGRINTIQLHTMLKRGESAVDTASNAAGLLWARGHTVVKLSATKNACCDVDGSFMLTDLPSYPFNHTTEY
ncbi:hypothetical protein ANO14919_112240 [Xylariales sp. No.14919]|nr:hypothetical protein ANO14919_112240 [Xylariales sp. No.14919]